MDRASNDTDVSIILPKFRTVGFPKAGLSDGAFPRRSGNYRVSRHDFEDMPRFVEA